MLMREICNSLIAQATKYVSGEQIFNMIENEEANTAVGMLKTTLHVCGAFKSTYIDYKTTANAECPLNPWKMQNNALFMRLDTFLERCHDILDLTQTIVQFSKLAKIEVGGTKGKTLTASIKQIYEDFLQAVAKFKAVPYDIMDVGAKTFDDDFYDFRCSIKELERRLGAVVSLAFDDCSTVYGRFKLLDSFEGFSREAYHPRRARKEVCWPRPVLWARPQDCARAVPDLQRYVPNCLEPASHCRCANVVSWPVWIVLASLTLSLTRWRKAFWIVRRQRK